MWFKLLHHQENANWWPDASSSGGKDLVISEGSNNCICTYLLNDDWPSNCTSLSCFASGAAGHTSSSISSSTKWGGDI